MILKGASEGLLCQDPLSSRAGEGGLVLVCLYLSLEHHCVDLDPAGQRGGRPALPPTLPHQKARSRAGVSGAEEQRSRSRRDGSLERERERAQRATQLAMDSVRRAGWKGDDSIGHICSKKRCAGLPSGWQGAALSAAKHPSQFGRNGCRRCRRIPPRTRLQPEPTLVDLLAPSLHSDWNV